LVLVFRPPSLQGSGPGGEPPSQAVCGGSDGAALVAREQTLLCSGRFWRDEFGLRLVRETAWNVVRNSMGHPRKAALR